VKTFRLKSHAMARPVSNGAGFLRRRPLGRAGCRTSCGSFFLGSIASILRASGFGRQRYEPGQSGPRSGGASAAPSRPSSQPAAIGAELFGSVPRKGLQARQRFQSAPTIRRRKPHRSRRQTSEAWLYRTMSSGRRRRRLGRGPSGSGRSWACYGEHRTRTSDPRGRPRTRR
jgi:hypothetical protein